MEKKLLAVSFGTSDPAVIAACIAPVEAALREAFPDRELVRAFTSRIIVRKLRGMGVHVETEQEALERLRAEGCEDILVVSTHLIPGREYDKLAANVAPLRPTEPLLASDADLERVAAMLVRLRKEEGRPLLLMGHGTDHAANELYDRLQALLPEDILLACAEGERTLDAISDRIDALETRSVTLAPFLLVAGEHAHNDLAGEDEDSWRSRLIARGFEVRCRLDGLGTYPEIREMFVEKVKRRT